MQNDQWNQQRSRLNHTEFGNGVLRFWSDSSRWRAVVSYLRGSVDEWDAESRSTWEGAFRKWHELSPEMAAHSQRIFEEFRPLRDGEEVLKGCTDHADFCIAATRSQIANDDRYTEWAAHVAKTITEVDQPVQRIERLMHVREQSGSCPESAQNIEAELVSLREAGRRLKTAFSGRGYFNYSESD